MPIEYLEHPTLKELIAQQRDILDIYNAINIGDMQTMNLQALENIGIGLEILKTLISIPPMIIEGGK